MRYELEVVLDLQPNWVASAPSDDLAAHPDNALAVVSGIRLEGASDAPTAVGGHLRVITPWSILNESLTPLAYRYILP